MKQTTKQGIREKTLYLGAGAGLVLFAIYGLLPGTFLGGALGLSLAGTVLGFPVTAGIIARMIVSISMLAGVLVTGTSFVAVGSILGWTSGLAAEALLGTGKPAEAPKAV